MVTITREPIEHPVRPADASWFAWYERPHGLPIAVPRGWSVLGLGTGATLGLLALRAYICSRKAM